MRIEQAVAILENGAGTQWDPRIVEAMVSYLREQHGEFPSFRPAGYPPLPVPPSVDDPVTTRGSAIPASVE